MEIRQLRYFVSVATLQSFTEAARRIYIAQPALSRQIKALEDELGVSLFVRTARGVQVTEAGQRLRQMAETVLQLVDDIPGNLNGHSDQPSGNVTVGLPPSIAYLIAPELIEASRERYPFVSLRIVENLSVVLKDWTEQGRVDIAVLTDPGHLLTLDRVELLSEDMVLIGAPGVFDEPASPISLADVQKYPLLISHGFQSVIEPWLTAHAVNLHFDMLLDSITIIKEIVQKGRYCSIVPYSMVHSECVANRLVARTLKDPAIMRRLVLANAARRPLSTTGRAIHELLIEHVGKIDTRLTLPGTRNAPLNAAPRMRPKAQRGLRQTASVPLLNEGVPEDDQRH